MTIKRIWHGYTTPERADEYEALLKAEVIAGIEAKAIPGFRKIEVLRRPLGDEVEFITVMEFDDLDSVKAFVGEDHEQAYVPDEARAILSRFDERSQHYEVEEVRTYEAGSAAAAEAEPAAAEAEEVEDQDGAAAYGETAPAAHEDGAPAAAYAAEAASEEVDERYESAPIIDAVPVVEPAEESLVSEEPVIAPPDEPQPEPQPVPQEAQPVLAPDKWFVRKDNGRGSVPATREGHKVVARFIFAMLFFGLAAVAMLVAAANGGPAWLQPAAPALFVAGSILTAIYFAVSAARHTDPSLTLSEYRRRVGEAR